MIPNWATADVREHVNESKQGHDVQGHESEELFDVVFGHLASSPLVIIHEGQSLQESRAEEKDWSLESYERHKVEEDSLLHVVDLLRVADDGKFNQIESDSPGGHEHANTFETVEHFQIVGNLLIIS